MIPYKKIIIALIFALTGVIPSVSAQSEYSMFLQRKQKRVLTAPLTFCVNTGVIFTEFVGEANEIYKQKDYNIALGISLDKRIYRNFSLRADIMQGKLTANNFKTSLSITDQEYSFYRDFATDIKYAGGISLVYSFPLPINNSFVRKNLWMSAWAGQGIMEFETQFNHFPDRHTYYGKVIERYSNAGLAVNYRYKRRVNLGLNYTLYFYNGYNLDAVKVHGGTHKDRMSYAFINFKFLLGKISEVSVTRDCYTF